MFIAALFIMDKKIHNYLMSKNKGLIKYIISNFMYLRELSKSQHLDQLHPLVPKWCFILLPQREVDESG